MRFALLPLLAGALAVTPAFAQASGQPSGGPVTFRTNVRLVRLLVTVKDSQDKLVGSLDRQDFSVTDCGVPQTISVFERQTELPLSVSLLVDISGSTAKDLRYEVVSIEKFLRTLIDEGNPRDAASLYTFNYDVTLQSGFTRRSRRLTDSLKALHPEGGTSLYDAITLAAREVGNRDGRHVIVVVTDGGDTTSHYTYQETLEAAQLNDAVIYPILVVPIPNDAGRNLGGEHALDALASGTGGLVFAPTVGAELDKAFGDILRDLRTQYLLGYYPRNLPADAPRFHPVHVELSHKDLRPQTRTGYYGVSSP
jgi:Ca-activated chloride channel family protein